MTEPAFRTAVRGVTLNNILNIRRGSPWRGLSQDQPDPDFCKFVEIIYCIRAACIILAAYRRSHQIETVQGVAARWAPPTENDTEAWVRNVQAASGLEPLRRLDLTLQHDCTVLLSGMIAAETGYRGWAWEQLNDGFLLAAAHADQGLYV